ncbi:flagellar filament capping protein FliD [Tunturibacter empetritectus]|uniref:Flagellar hook-associated protein 2 n=1 Tax=Tunturiibacter empetritectus TaxID=3069691 RepID=A0A7W8IFS8_9BACT|nr:flagellar filament capping protein FliD [Edaphobacter lichenicola]MBB5316366.1 flagellar hook-associated protein 2 [Edaphobacter lichenicola]
MGTVGLSFGSATSGQGFDVASTVTAIQASEQAIETPWNNQLTTLKAQDTVFSGLGTDLGSLTTALQALTDFNGVFAEKLGSSSNTDLLSLTSAGSSAVAGSHTVTITQLAQTSSDVSTAIPSASDTLTGTVTIQGKVFDTGTSGSNTLTGLASAINSAAIGVKASVITDSSGSRLSLVSGTSGAAGQLATITSTLADGGTSITFPGPPNSGQQGQDAQITLDGVQVTSPSNTVTGAISGVTFQLLSSASPGTQVQVQVTDNTTDIGTAVSNFVSAYNTVIKDINTEETNSSTGTAPALLGSPILAQLQSQLTGALFGGSASGSINNFGQLGISMNNDGTLTLDSSTLTSALSSNLSDVTGFFQNSGSFGQTLTTAVNNLGTQAPNGAIYLAQQQNAAQEKALNADITNENTLLSEQKTQLTNELNAANQILQSIPSQLNQVNEIYSAVTGFNQNPR